MYGRRPLAPAEDVDALAHLSPEVHRVLGNRFYVDEFYAATVIRLNALLSRGCDLLDRWLWGGLTALVAYGFLGLAWVGKFFEDNAINRGFDLGCRRLDRGAGRAAGWQDGLVHNYLRALGVGFATLLLILTWGCQS